MNGVGLSITVGDLAAANALIARFAELDEAALLETVGTIGESQTRRRIEEEKTGPDGEAWPPNLEGNPILLRSGRHLRDSIAFEVGAGEVQWGSSWEFAHIHQDGAVITVKKAKWLRFVIRGKVHFRKSVKIPARPFVGLSAENGTEIEQVTIEWLSGLAR
ncbi:phage virion morphogenesis protein [Methylobacterium sp. SyP6R]|uniref:phage virion morphogenesis protein n=1 Tax=Methylobacterium sp. SyP6R TaxID=2718876 RepID=UPI001F16B9A9|nr:phage virion morphogenesis protein [Methylobacterium sp. SyP6R]MCF4125041.1 phage virion morphogenesis protein [Methylobacterium sp. SyP6R]